MKQYHLRTFENLKPDPNIKYINECCKFCDVVLEILKGKISRKLSVLPENLITGQEDWGWYLEFEKDNVFYNLGISYWERDEESAYNFGLTVEAVKLKKGFLFNRRFEAAEECEEFAEMAEKIAKENDFEIFEE